MALEIDLRFPFGLRLSKLYLERDRVSITAKRNTVMSARRFASRTSDGNFPERLVKRDTIKESDSMNALLIKSILTFMSQGDANRLKRIANEIRSHHPPEPFPMISPHFILSMAMRPNMPDVKPVKAGWWNAFRPWTLHGAVVPILIGGNVAYCEESFDALDWAIFIMILVAACLMQAAANLLNTYGDFKRGTDTVDNESRSPELVTGVLDPEDVKKAGILCLAIVCVFGLVFIWHSGWGILPYGLVGLAGAGLYTTGIAYKYHGLGQPSVFLMMGLLMPLGTYFVMTSSFSWDVLLMSIPNAFLITAVLCGNETRDHAEDKAAGVHTLCGSMTRDGALKLYLVENAVAFPVLAMLIVSGVLHWACALAFVALYDLYLLSKNAHASSDDAHANFMLVPMAFRMNWHFGVLLVIGYLVGNLVI